MRRRLALRKGAADPRMPQLEPGGESLPSPGQDSQVRYQRNGQQKDKALAYSRFSSEYEDLAALSDGKSFW